MSQTTTKIPDEFICPITQTIMLDPYIDVDGHSYEKKAIVSWLEQKKTSPITRNPMTLGHIFPNRTLKSLIENFLAQHPEVHPIEPPAVLIDTFLGFRWDEARNSEALGRKPLILYTVIDTSGSMQVCEEQNQAGEKGGESEVFSRLDLVKHTLNTIATSLTPSDRICVIRFSSAASVCVPLMTLSEENKKTVMTKVNELEADGQTNIWDGMREAIDQIALLESTLDDPTQADDFNVAIYLLTDGEPTIHPPAPIDATIEKYMRRHLRVIKPSVSTFGYGYVLDSQMLLSIVQKAPIGVQPGCFGKKRLGGWVL
eukprot:scaffold6573_cov159-Ochromonas_danica.AAC.1